MSGAVGGIAPGTSRIPETDTGPLGGVQQTGRGSQVGGVTTSTAAGSTTLQSDESIPRLPAPKAFDSTELLSKFLAIKVKLNDEMVATGMEDVKHQGEVQKLKNEEIAKQIMEAAEKLAASKNSSSIMKIFGWIAVALTVVAAVATGGALAFAAAALAVTMATLTETGVMDKMTEAIAKKMMEGGMSESDANKWAMIATLAITIAATALTLGAGFAAGAGTTAQVADKAVKAASMAQRIGTMARYGEAAASVAQSGAGLASGIQSKEASDIQADTMDVKKFLAKIRQEQEDEMQRVQEMVLGIQTMTRRVFETIESQSASSDNINRHIG